MSGFDIEAIRADFPALHQEVRGKRLVYLDSAATSLKPKAVIEAVNQVYERDCGNIHRAVHLPSQRATQSYEGTRKQVQAFLGAAKPSEIIFTSGTTQSINMVAQCYGRPRLGAGDKVLITGLEHHSNIVPWQMVCEQTGAELVVAHIDDDGDVPLERIEEHLKAGGVRIVAFAHVSNALGTVLPAKEICALAKAHDAITVVDGAQAVPHTFEKTTYAELPNRLEAGTPNIAGVIGMGAALTYLDTLDWPAVQKHEEELFAYADSALRDVKGLRRIGTAKHSMGALSFFLDCAHPHDIGTIVDTEGVALRTGHHCAQPVMKAFGVPATARASLAFYNNRADVDALIASVRTVQEMFS